MEEGRRIAREAEHAALQARVLATAAEAIRIITALVYPILPESAAKVWRQLGQGEIADAAKKSFLTNLAWGGLKAGTKFGEPAPLFPRAEKDAVERMQNIEEQNSKTVIEAASQQEEAGKAAAAPRVGSVKPPVTTSVEAPPPGSVKPPVTPPGHAVNPLAHVGVVAPISVKPPVTPPGTMSPPARRRCGSDHGKTAGHTIGGH